MRLPEKGEPLELADIADVNENKNVQKALRRLATDAASKPISRLVMWHLTGKLDWDTLAVLSEDWANRYELTLARDFVGHLDSLTEGETGRILFDVNAADAPSEAYATELKTALKSKTVLGLVSDIGIPARPQGPAVAVRVKMTSTGAQVLVTSSDAVARNWVSLGKFTIPVLDDQGKFNTVMFADALAEGTLNRLVRVQLSKGVKDRGKMHYQLRIDNASPLVLNGLAAVGTTSKPDVVAKVLSGICLSPRRSMNVPASEEVVKELGLKKGIKLVAVDLSGL